MARPRSRKGHPKLEPVILVNVEDKNTGFHDKVPLQCTAYYTYKRPRVVFWVKVPWGKHVFAVLRGENLRRMCQAFEIRDCARRFGL